MNPMTDDRVTIRRLTSAMAGAIGIIEVTGPAESLTSLAATLDPAHSIASAASAPTHVRLGDFGGIDRGIFARVNDTCLLLMPHGGAYVMDQVHALVEHLIPDILPATSSDRPAHDALIGLLSECGATQTPDPNAIASAVEKAAAEALPFAASPGAVDLFLIQPKWWRAWAASGMPAIPDLDERSRQLEHLIDPPIIVCAGATNIGKSTLANRLAGRRVAAAADRPGVTRDPVRVNIDLGGLRVAWHDAPGFRAAPEPRAGGNQREADSSIDDAAEAAARRLITTADFIVSAADVTHEWPEIGDRAAGLRIALRPDLGVREDADLVVDGLGGVGIDELATAVRRRLVPADAIDAQEPWAWTPALRTAIKARITGAPASPGSRI